MNNSDATGFDIIPQAGNKKNSSPDCARDWRSDVNRVLDNYQLP
ncbi:hypothetical protein [Microcoleus sp. OTE_8_concoct_300]